MTRRPLSKSVLLSDFDETIVTIDTGEFALEHFADPSWKQIAQDYEKGHITFEDSLRKEFGLLKVSERVILEQLEKVVVLRPHFEELVAYCKSHNVSLIVVSGGLDFCIRHFLDRSGWLKFIKIYSPMAKHSSEGYKLSFPELFDKESLNFKADLARYHKRRGSKVFFIGDGVGDYPAAKEADFAFAIRGSKLAMACRKGNVPHKEITDFQEVIATINELQG